MRDRRDITRDIPLLGDPGGQPGTDCPDEATLAAYAESTLDAGRQTLLEEHLADCSCCLGQIGFLVREADPVLPAVPTELLDAARSPRRRRWLSRPKAPAWGALAAAAALVLAATVVLQIDRTSDPAATDSATSAEAPDRTVRNGGTLDTTLDVLEPRDGARLEVRDVDVRWQPAPQALQYAVLVVSLEGDVVWEGHTTLSEITIPHGILAPGERYFLWVEARLPGGGTLKSTAVGFLTASD
jgi:hypothetical protein